MLVAPFSAVFGHALLIVVGDPSAPLGGEAREALRGLLSAGGIALDRVFAASAASRWDLRRRSARADGREPVVAPANNLLWGHV